MIAGRYARPDAIVPGNEMNGLSFEPFEEPRGHVKLRRNRGSAECNRPGPRGRPKRLRRLCGRDRRRRATRRWECTAQNGPTVLVWPERRYPLVFASACERVRFHASISPACSSRKIPRRRRKGRAKRKSVCARNHGSVADHHKKREGLRPSYREFRPRGGPRRRRKSTCQNQDRGASRVAAKRGDISNR